LSSKYKQSYAARSILASWRREVRQCAFTDFFAARRLQARWRATAQRKSYKRYKAARCLQSTRRGALHPDVYQIYLAKPQRDFETKTSAPTKIHSFRRGEVARGAMLGTDDPNCLTRACRAFKKCVAVRKVQSIWRCKSGTSCLPRLCCGRTTTDDVEKQASSIGYAANATSPPDESKHSGVECRCILCIRNTLPHVKSKQSGVGLFAW
jgi:hypothetical protein